jgi:hypothetical protein
MGSIREHRAVTRHRVHPYKRQQTIVEEVRTIHHQQRSICRHRNGIRENKLRAKANDAPEAIP